MIVLGVDEVQAEDLKDKDMTSRLSIGKSSKSSSSFSNKKSPFVTTATNTSSYWEDLNGETITVIYLFNAY